ncbi:MAG: ABC transporter ATP-binding protein [Actinomycetota bacterium]|nr:ABC transporter ATP-binding protein [Actinomycetota bacterium]
MTAHPDAANVQLVEPMLEDRVLEPVCEALPAEPLLELLGITKRWPRLERPVLDDVDLELQPGTVTWVGGRNGIGKTTLMRIAAGLIRADGGSVRLDGLHPVRDRGAYMSRSAFLSAGSGGLYARLPVRWHLNWWARLAFLPAERRRQVVEVALERFELTELASRRVDRMSMGQRQRVRLAGIFLHEPDVILLDEPRNSLDTEGVEILTSAVSAATARGAAVLWCAPTGEEAKIESDRRFELEHGRLVQA